MTANQTNSRRILAFRHLPIEGLGLIAPIVADHHLSVEYVDLYRGGLTPPDIAAAAGLIFLGGPMSVNDPLPYLAEESALITQAIHRGQPVLGICLGSQLIARTLGARVYRNPGKEIGWFDIHLTGAAGDDAIFSRLDSTETVFHWHGETFDLPAGATHLAWSEACANQAFRFGSNVYGLQFHLEVTPEMIAAWCLHEDNAGDVRDLPAPIDPHRHAARLRELSQLVFGEWCKLL